MGFATSQQLADLMERVHFSVFGKTIAERRESSASLWPQATIDYNHYDHWPLPLTTNHCRYNH